tara:strand:- start:292 stop:639 length:348 start_codon:yes stop_codon:yes gene_type:complete
MGKMQRRKGANGERELARLISLEGFPAKRGGQFQSRDGAVEGADVIVDCLPWLHIECKRQNKFISQKLRDALIQAEADKRDGQVACVVSREDGCDWLATLRLVDLVAIIREGGDL